ncbi:hypothetical protein ACEPAF_9159 [Sanghuangporus sanghuang]
MLLLFCLNSVFCPAPIIQLAEVSARTLRRGETVMSSSQFDTQDVESLTSQAVSSWSRFKQTGFRGDIDLTISLDQIVLDLCPHGHPERVNSLQNLALGHRERYKRWRDIGDLEKAIVLYEEALALLPDDCPDRPINSLASCLRSRFEHSRRIDDLEESIKLDRAILALQPQGHPSRHYTLGLLAVSLKNRFRLCQIIADLEESIELDHEALALRPEGNTSRPYSLCNLGSSLWTRFQQSGRMYDLDESIILHRAALELRPDGHPHRHLSLGNLALALTTRFEHRGKNEDLEESITLHRAALALRPEGNPERSKSLSSLANSLRIRFLLNGRIADLEESIELERSALIVRTEDHPDRSKSLESLATCLWTRFQHSGRVDDLEETIPLQRTVLSLRLEGHPHHNHSLSSLATCLWTRFHYGGRVDDLEESIRLYRAALAVLPEGHPDHHHVLGNLASALSDCFRNNGRIEDLNESIALDRAALALRSEGHPDRPVSLGNLALSLGARFQQGGKIEDLEESIVLQRDALEFRPEGHPHRHNSLGNLATSLLDRFGHSGRIEDIEESIKMSQAALDLRPDEHPDSSRLLYNLALSLYSRFEKEGRTEDLEESIDSLSHAADHALSRSSDRFRAAHRWTTLARSHDHRTTLEAYRTTMSIIQRALTIRPTLSSRHEFLSSDSCYRTLALDASSYAIEKGDLARAIELLEQGRALLWSQMRGFRSPLERLSEADSALAVRLGNCSHALEALSTSSEPRSAISDVIGGSNGIHAYSGLQNQQSIDQMLVQVRQLSQEQEELIKEVRRIPGFEDFLQASPFEVLQQAASEGPVIVLNHSVHRCDVLIALPGKEVPCTCVPLDEDFYADAITLHDELIRVRQEYRVSSAEYDEVLRRVMKVLWERVVSKVVQKLKELGYHEGSRIWWCPTSVLSALPFHAAGPYQGADGITRYLLDDYISSYTPTLKSLITARSGVADGGGRMLFIADTKLPSAKKEKDTIRRIRRIDKLLLDDQATPEVVLRRLRRVQWVHFVCHGLLDEEPFKSSLKLSGGNLTLLDIARANLPNAELAFLSACHTAEQHPKAAMDEVLHLSSAMQFCGFRSVIVIYTYLMRELEVGEVRFKRAAAAARDAALRLKERGDEGLDGLRVEMKAERWVNLVHIGA